MEKTALACQTQHSRTEMTLYLPTSPQTRPHLCFHLMDLTPPSFISPKYSLPPNPANLPPHGSGTRFLLYIWRPSCLVYRQVWPGPCPQPTRSALLPSICSPLQPVDLTTVPFPPFDGFSLLWGSKAKQPVRLAGSTPEHLSSLGTYSSPPCPGLQPLHLPSGPLQAMSPPATAVCTTLPSSPTWLLITLRAQLNCCIPKET